MLSCRFDASYSHTACKILPHAASYIIKLLFATLRIITMLTSFVGTANWECSQHIAAASATIIRHMIVPNLVWRVGKSPILCVM